MAFEKTKEQYVSRDNNFYKSNYYKILIILITLIIITIAAIGIVFYQVTHKPLPQFHGVTPDAESMLLTPYDEPNLLPSTILSWASKAATVAYTFDFVRYNQQINAARPFFTDDGWQDYLNSVNKLIASIVQNKLFVYGVVSGTPVISNQGELPGKGYVWRIQIPFLVTYVSDPVTTNRNFYVILSVVRVPTSINKQGIGIDQFVMV